MTRRERREDKRQQAAEAELAVRVARAQRRLAQATGPLPVNEPRHTADRRAAGRSAIVDY